MPKRLGPRAQIAAIEKKLDRAKGSLICLRYDIPRAAITQEKAKVAHAKAKRQIERMYKRRAELQGRVELFESEIAELTKWITEED